MDECMIANHDTKACGLQMQYTAVVDELENEQEHRRVQPTTSTPALLSNSEEGHRISRRTRQIKAILTKKPHPILQSFGSDALAVSVGLFMVDIVRLVLSCVGLSIGGVQNYEQNFVGWIASFGSLRRTSSYLCVTRSVKTHHHSPVSSHVSLIVNC
jgi:hypothetical protein